MKTFAQKIAPYFLSVKTKKEMCELLEAAFTPSELRTLATRFELIKMLKKGVSQHEIAQKLGIGVGTVTRGSRELQLGHFKNV